MAILRGYGFRSRRFGPHAHAVLGWLLMYFIALTTLTTTNSLLRTILAACIVKAEYEFNESLAPQAFITSSALVTALVLACLARVSTFRVLRTSRFSTYDNVRWITTDLERIEERRRWDEYLTIMTSSADLSNGSRDEIGVVAYGWDRYLELIVPSTASARHLLTGVYSTPATGRGQQPILQAVQRIGSASKGRIGFTETIKRIRPASKGADAIGVPKTSLAIRLIRGIRVHRMRPTRIQVYFNRIIPLRLCDERHVQQLILRIPYRVQLPATTRGGGMQENIQVIEGVLERRVDGPLPVRDKSKTPDRAEVPDRSMSGRLRLAKKVARRAKDDSTSVVGALDRGMGGGFQYERVQRAWP
ncbi:hypothetical protein EDD18DRAFT_1358088 [Armillaria luteobubalina]|uniref:Uncharacterized protein n=1 Tax=Armillaria luteobubalina TaxID=153913 RepID=A0AA39UQ14_9AGAR|nr:hypothetical protein EDD18DRAFT_1358088 [Armillaria luteobubalina]